MSKIKTRTSLYIMVGILSGTISLTTFNAISNTVFAENVDYKVNLESSLVVTVPTNTVVLDINPATSAFSSKDLGVTVGTNNPTGYTLTMSADGTDLTKTTGTAAVIPTLETLSGGYTENTFTVNHWGYKLPTTNYLPFATSVQLDSTDAPTVNKTSTVTFGAKANVEQPAGAYELEINFAAVANPLLPTLLYNNIASLSKGKNTDPESHFSWTEITEPTSEIPSADTSTSGVFEWDGMTTGNGVDSNGGSQKIYFYRGILNNDGSGISYGSNGSANAYPNYVKLANNTCWRIVRTTSTGGVKMMYNGMWNSGTSTCANTNTAARLTDSPFNTDSATVAGTTYKGLEYHNIHAVGYTYSNLAAGTESATPISTIFGSTGNDTATNTNSSIIKQYIEDWYENNMTDYTSKLEGDAGYCNDRSLYSSASGGTPLADDTGIIPYGTTSMTAYYFGSYIRNANSSTFSPTLTCPRGKVDLYSYTNNAGNGNGQLTYPIAFLTADEASLAGNGWDNLFSAYNTKSYLVGTYPWLLSPYHRQLYGSALGFGVYSYGRLVNAGIVSSEHSVRPVISLAPGTMVLGSGTATEPWEVQ
ncbi:hypothetical protein IJ101_01450 [Candidatus Saccharibacteria bacterium]|nr:hypothetical protein [Candidatus Saccharibacteria bacterium]